MPRRPSVSKSDLDKVRLFLREIGKRVAKVEIEPGRVVITTTSGLTLEPAYVDEQVPNWKRRQIAAAKAGS